MKTGEQQFDKLGQSISGGKVKKQVK